MHRRLLIIVAVVALLVVTGVTVGLVSTRAQGEADLATITPAQLLADVAQHAGDVSAVSGSVSWKNNLLDLGQSMFSFGGQGTGDLSSLLASGSGRIWLQDGKFRFEIQGFMGDTIIVGDKTTVWVYTYSSNTATEYTLPASPGTASGTGQTTTTQSPQTTVTNPVAAIDQFIQKLAPDATVSIANSVTVAGRTCYVLSLVPKAPNTVFGSVQVAIDSQTYLPLKLDVFAKEPGSPVLTAGFTGISFSPSGADLFTFTPPANATVNHKSLTLPPAFQSQSGASSPSTTQSTESTGAAEKAPLTLAEAAAQAGFTPLAPQTSDPALGFAGAYVIPAHQVDLQSLLSQLQSGVLGSGILGAGSSGTGSSSSGGTAGSGSSGPNGASVPQLTLPSGQITLGPTVIQRYGQGFGTIVLVQAKIPAELEGQIDQLLAGVPLLGHATVGGATVYQLNTALGSIAIWRSNDSLLAAAGSVSPSDLTGFVASVR